MMTIITLPWAPKIFYGILIDTFPICGSTKRSYLVLLGLIVSVAILICGIFDFETHWPLVWLLTVVSACTAMMDVVVDGLMVS